MRVDREYLTKMNDYVNVYYLMGANGAGKKSVSTALVERFPGQLGYIPVGEICRAVRNPQHADHGQYAHYGDIFDYYEDERKVIEKKMLQQNPTTDHKEKKRIKSMAIDTAESMARGVIINDMTVRMIEDGYRHIIWDGVARTKDRWDILEDHVTNEFLQLENMRRNVIYLEVSRKNSMARVTGRREDDAQNGYERKEDKIWIARTRYDHHVRETKPVVAMMRSIGIPIYTIDANRPLEQVILQTERKVFGLLKQ